MPRASTRDGIQLYYEEAGSGPPVVFVHEYAGRPSYLGAADAALRTLPPLRHLQPARLSALRHPERPGQISSRTPLSRRRRRGDGCAEDRQGPYRRPFDGRCDRAPRRHSLSRALHLGRGRRLWLWLQRRPQKGRGGPAPPRARPARCSPKRPWKRARGSMATARVRQAHKNKDPLGTLHFVKMLSEHSPLGHSLIMANLQAKRAVALGDGSGPEEVQTAAPGDRRRRG